MCLLISQKQDLEVVFLLFGSILWMKLAEQEVLYGTFKVFGYSRALYNPV